MIDYALKDRGVDMIMANLSHPAWIDGCRSNGFAILQNKRLFAASPKFHELMEPFGEVQKGLHLTNLDGHGPWGLVQQ